MSDSYSAAERATIEKYLLNELTRFKSPRTQGPPPVDVGGGFPPLPVKKESRISLDGVKWLIKGGSPAPPDAGFAYVFTTDKNGNPNQYSEIVDFLKESGPVTVEGYTYSLSKDGKFLQRKLEVKNSCSSTKKQ
ncbi:MAG: hypothetical protein NTY03_04225 [Candidatus Bathyarchaeota archaeon]|nr:hypothetical protein [Candidatus Bathyarchaeota archaeon]